MIEGPSAQALAALAAVMSLVEALFKRGVIDQPAVDTMLREAGTYAQALCVDCSHEVEREVQQLLAAIGKAEVSPAETAPIPLVDPA
jgi:hypothetical protein